MKLCTGLLLVLLLAACAGPAPVVQTPVVGGVPPAASATVPVPRTGGTEPITPQPASTHPVRPTPTAWFPMVRYVAASVLPYDRKETIRILPVYACPAQACLWLGDLPAGTQVTVTALSEDGQDCFVGGKAVQGWMVEGWVSCSRLEAQQPTEVP